MIRILLLALVLWIAYRLIRNIIGPAKHDRPREVDYEDMVTCDHCGVHLPRSEALVRKGKNYCSARHADASDDAPK